MYNIINRYSVTTITKRGEVTYQVANHRFADRAAAEAYSARRVALALKRKASRSVVYATTDVRSYGTSRVGFVH